MKTSKRTSKRSKRTSAKLETRKRNAKLERFAPVSRDEREKTLTPALRKLKSATVAELFEAVGGDGTFPTPRAVYNTLHHYGGDWPDSSDVTLYEQAEHGAWRVRKPNRSKKNGRSSKKRSSK
jgi:hypothetical protein